jgi:hypothetical protein
MKNAEHNIWSIRQFKIEEFKKKMKKPLMELRKQGMLKEKEEREQREREENERKVRESEALKRGEELQKILALKKIIIADIVHIKEQRVVRIMDKKIEFLTDEEIDNLSLEVLQQHLENTRKKISNNKEQRLKKTFTHIDYLERERRDKLAVKARGLVLKEEEQKRIHEQYATTATNNYHEHNEQRARLHNLAKFYVFFVVMSETENIGGGAAGVFAVRQGSVALQQPDSGELQGQGDRSGECVAGVEQEEEGDGAEDAGVAAEEFGVRGRGLVVQEEGAGCRDFVQEGIEPVSGCVYV